MLCTKCFGKHHKSKCESRKSQFKDYVINFAEQNPDFPEKGYGRWIELIRATRGANCKFPLQGQAQLSRMWPQHLCHQPGAQKLLLLHGLAKRTKPTLLPLCPHQLKLLHRINPPCRLQPHHSQPRISQNRPQLRQTFEYQQI